MILTLNDLNYIVLLIVFFLLLKTITTEKLIGSFVKLRTENNDIVVKALYAENFNIKSKKSNVLIKNAKGDGVIDLENGKIDIGTHLSFYYF